MARRDLDSGGALCVVRPVRRLRVLEVLPRVLPLLPADGSLVEDLVKFRELFTF